MRKGVRRALTVFIIALPFVLISQMLHDVEHTGDNVLEHGLKIIDWHPVTGEPVTPPARVTATDIIEPRFIQQGKLYDCRFLSSLASYISTDRGKTAVRWMLAPQEDGSCKVTFTGVPAPIEVGPLTTKEIDMYAHATDYLKQSGGYWLPVLEKAYGTYRNRTQPPYMMFLRSLKHYIERGQWTPDTLLPGYGATFGGTDDGAILALTGHQTADYSTFAYDCGDFGLGNGYVTVRQLASWLNREKVRKEYLAEQDRVLQANRRL